MQILACNIHIYDYGIRLLGFEKARERQSTCKK